MFGRRLPGPVGFTQSMAYGLKDKDGVDLPLAKVEVKVTMLDFLAEVCLEQSYRNTDKEGLEVVYTFPIPSGATLRHFEVHIDDAVIKGQVQEKQEARDTYDDAVASGHTGFMVEQDEAMPDVFTCRVGNLAPHAKATVQLIYALQVEEEVSADGKSGDDISLRLVIPSAVAPRYTPRDHPPPHSETTPLVAVGSPAKDLLHITGEITSSTRITGLEPLFPVEDNKLTTDILPDTESLRAKFSMVDSALQDDFVLSIKLEGRHKDRAWVDRKSGAMVLAVCRSHQDYQNEAQGEFLFVIDRSGSMGGQSINAAREALALCVSSLPEGAKFNIISFGSSFSKWSDTSRVFDDHSKAEALQLCKTMEADMGGTEILEPLRDIASTAVNDQAPRQVFVITDGQVGNTGEVVEEVKTQAKKSGTRFFSFGIGSGVSSALVKGIAKAGRGEAVFIVDAQERMQSKIMQQMNRALSAPLTNASVDWGTLRLTQEASPTKLPPLFAGSRVLVHAMVDPASLPASNAITLSMKATSPDGPVEVPITARLTDTTGSSSSLGPLLTSLAARSRLSDLEQAVEAASDDTTKSTVKARAVELSKSTGVLCAYTSFVAVKEQTDAVTGSLKRVDIPLQIIKPSTGGSGFGGMPHPMARGRMLMAAAPMAMCCMSAPAPPPMQASFCASSVGGGGTMMGRPSRELAPPAPPGAMAFSSMPSMAPMAPKKKSMAKESKKDVMMEVEEEASGHTLPPLAVDHVSLVNRQKASGAWEMDEAIIKLAKSALPGFKEGITGPGGLSDPVVWSTVVVLILLEKLFSQYEEEWKAASLKSRRWLAKSVAGVPVDDLVAQAKAVLL